MFEVNYKLLLFLLCTFRSQLLASFYKLSV